MEMRPEPYSYDWWLMRDIRWYLHEIARKNRLRRLATKVKKE